MNRIFILLSTFFPIHVLLAQRGSGLEKFYQGKAQAPSIFLIHTLYGISYIIGTFSIIKAHDFYFKEHKKKNALLFLALAFIFLALPLTHHMSNIN